MYAGRDFGDRATRGSYFQLHETLNRNEIKITIFKVTEKAPLANYLERGLRLAKEVGISLEQLSPLEPPRDVHNAGNPQEPLSSQAPGPFVSQLPQPDEFDSGPFRRGANGAWIEGLLRLGNGHLATKTWTAVEEIMKALNTVTTPNSNHLFFPTGGGNDLESVCPGREDGCIEVFFAGNRRRSPRPAFGPPAGRPRVPPT